MEDCNNITKCIVSIIIPIFNRKDLVRLMVNSIIEQTFHDWELLLIDDGSAEDTIEMLRQFTVEDKRIHFYSREKLPKGAPACRNIGLNHAKGKYVIFFDSDDLIPPHTLSQRVNFMEEHTDLDFSVFPAVSFVDKNKIGEGERYYVGIQLEKNDLKHIIDCHLPFLVVTNIYRRTALLKQNITWDENLMSLQDADFNIQNIIKNNQYKYADAPLVDYYIRVIPQSGSISQNIRRRTHYDSHLYFIKKLFEELSQEHKKENRWAIRRRIVYIYTLLENDKEEYLRKLKALVYKYDKSFYYLFGISINCYSFAQKLHIPKSLHFSFPYYTIYMVFHGLINRRKTNKMLKNNIIKL